MDHKENKKIVVRFAPSPTGLLHVGAFRAAIFNYLFAKKNGGKLILRIEDTDTERSKKEYEENILESIAWLGLSFDETYRQSERKEIYKKNLQNLIDSGKAYVSQETEGDRTEVIRFKNPNKEVVFNDLIRGEIKFNTTELGDFVIAKSLEEPIFHLAVVVDDCDMGITHVIRGEDHISNTPRQILIIEALGKEVPTYAHLPLVLAPDKSKLSKRHGAKAVTEYRDEGYLKEAIINYMALLGWNPGTEQEIFSVEELIQEFDLDRVQKGGAIFNPEKLKWINKEHLKKLPKETVMEEVAKRFSNFNQLDVPTKEKLLPIIIDRISIWSDLDEMLKIGELDYVFKKPDYSAENLVWKKSTKEKTLTYLENLISKLKTVPNTNWSNETIKNAVWDYASAEGRGDVLWPMRYALSGKEKSPDPFTIADIIGQTETLERLMEAMNKINQ